MSVISSFESDLDAWFQDNQEHQEAYNRIRACYQQKTERLNLRGLGLTSIPDCIVQCTALKTLVLSKNKLRSLPDLSQCPNLENLSLESNQIEDLTQLSINKLKSLRVRGNPLSKPLPPAAKELDLDLLEGRRSYDQGAKMILLYDMVQDLGIEKKPNVLRVSHSTAPKFGPKITNLLKDLGAKVEEADADFPEIDQYKLSEEVQAAILSASSSSIPEEILKSASPYSEIGKIREHAKKLLEGFHGLALPGGPDIESEFYNQPAYFDNTKDYRRSMAEFALIAAAKERGIPIIGTCRGAQMLNVYGGGTLETLDDWESGWKELTLEDRDLADRFGRDTFKTFSRHHQACSTIAPGFKVVMRDKNVPKLLIGDQGRMIATQVHPEADQMGFHSGIIRIYELFFQKTQECFA